MKQDLVSSARTFYTSMLQRGVGGAAVVACLVIGFMLWAPSVATAFDEKGTPDPVEPTEIKVEGKDVRIATLLPFAADQLLAMGVTPVAGRWWLDATGSYGVEGSAIPLGNLMMNMLAGRSGGGGGTGQRRSVLSTYDRCGATVL